MRENAGGLSCLFLDSFDAEKSEVGDADGDGGNKGIFKQTVLVFVPTLSVICGEDVCHVFPELSHSVLIPKQKIVPPQVPPSSLPSCIMVIDLQLGLGLLAALQPLANEEAEKSDSDCNTWLANKRTPYPPRPW